MFAVAVIVATTVFGQPSGGGTRTVRDGVYSEEQAKRGKTVYEAKCDACHDGSTMGPQLKNDAFLAEWENKNVRELYGRILSTMPENDPGSLSENETLDILAYMLQANGFPAGPRALERASELDSVYFVRGK